MNRSAILATLLAVVVAVGTACQSEGMDEAGDTGGAAPPASAMGDGTAGALLDPEAATLDQLVAVPGMNAQAADALIAGRPHESMLAVDSALAPHLAAAERETVYRHLWKPLDLNTASDAEILLIPNLGERMLHEFKEYRPYTSIEQFRREIGKYVDDEEVARLERYVTIAG